MKIKNQDQSGTVSEDRAQLILIGGLVVAVAVVAIALVIGGGLFSQSTVDDGGLSSFASQTADQLQTAATVGGKNLEYANENSTLYEGAYPNDLCGELVNSTEVQQLVATQLNEGESVANIEIKQECEELKKNNTSWLTGQNKESQLPAVNVSEAKATEVTSTCQVLSAQTGYASNKDAFDNKLVDVAPSPIPGDLSNSTIETALDATPGIDLSPIRSDPVLDGPADGVYKFIEKCLDINVQSGRNPADIVFAIDTTGSMDSSTEVTKSWQTAPHGGVFPSEDLTSTHRPDTGVTIPDEWIDVRCATSVSCFWSGGSVGDIVYDNNANRFAKIDSNSPTTVCGFFSCYDAWDVEYRDGSTAQVRESDLFNADYRLGAPQRMWFTQVGMKNAVDDLNKTVPDRAGLLEYDANYAANPSCTACPTTEHAGIVGVNDNTHRDLIKETVDNFMPGGNTNIEGALEASKDILDDDYGNGPEASTDATKNIVLMTDGQYTDGEDPETYIQSNTGKYDDIYIHSVVLGSSAANDQDAVEDMAALANDPNPDLSSSSVDPSSLPSTTPDRPEGTLIASDDPSDAEGIFEDIIGNIEDDTDTGDNVTSSPNPDVELKTQGTSNSGALEEIYDARMNITDFNGNGSYVLKFTDTDDDDNEVVAWQMKVDSIFTGPDKVEFSSETNGDLNATVDTDSPNQNVSDPGEYIWMDLRNKGPKPMFDVGSLSTGDIETQLQSDGVPSSISSPKDYMEAAWSEVEDEIEGKNSETDYTEGVSIVAEFKQGTLDGKFNGKEETANGTFSLEFKPIDGNFSKVGGIEGGGFEDDCGDGSGSLPATCGLKDNDREAVSTAQIKKAKIEVTVEGPEGRSNKTIAIPPDGEYSYDIFE
jgi:hypothetical protein